jgi:mannosylglycerate hydrolase MGH1-like protein
LRARADKWYVGAGDGLLWAPPFPAWLDSPGYWDEAHLFQYAIQPVFTLAFLIDGAVLEPRCLRRRWTPDGLDLDYTLDGPSPLRARETRAASGAATLASRWEIRNAGSRPVTLDVVCWTAVDGATLAAADVHAGRGTLTFTRSVTDRKGHSARVASRLALSPAAGSWAAYRSQVSTSALPPRFALTPFWDRWQVSGRLRNEMHLEGIDPTGLVFLGVQRRLRIPPRGVGRVAAQISFALGAANRRLTDRRLPDRRFSSVPTFRCSDPFLERHWEYRWYGLRLNGIAAGAAPNYPYPAVTEGIGYFHVPISYSAQCHLRELRWLPDPAWARGVLRTFLHHQRADGALPGRVYADHLEGTDFYHADWGGALEALDAVHPDPAFLAEVFPGLARYAEWLLATRDRDGSGMLDVVDQYETGQEYMSRYQAVDPDADRYGWENRIRLKGIDVTVYGYRLFRALQRIAPAAEAERRWREAADRTARAVRERMWDEGAGMFFDVHPATGARTGVKAAVCFYPYFTDLAGASHIAGMGRHLFNPREFWTPFPVPSSSADDPRFDPDAEWKGKRHNCPWNGRVWPMTNAHVIEALARVVRGFRPEWAPRLGQLLGRFARMMTYDGDPDRPNGFEHYHPYTGRGSLYRGIDDYQHSWVNDLIVQHLLGVLPHGATGVTIHPLALGVRRAAVDDLPLAGHRLRIAVDGKRFRVAVDGRAAGQGRVGEPLTVAF